MTEKKEDKQDDLPFQGKADRLEREHQHGFSPSHLLLLGALAAIVLIWVLGLQFYDPSAENSITEELAHTGARTEEAVKPEPVKPPIMVEDLLPEQIAWRDQALEILSELAPLLDSLEKRAVLQWADEDYAALREQVTAGEQAYAEQRFRDARDIYEQSLQQAKIIEATAPQAFAAYFQKGQQFISAKNYEEATEQLDVARLIDPSDQAVIDALNTARNGEAVDRLLTKARFALDEEQPDEAINFLKEASALDAVRTDIKNMVAEAVANRKQKMFSGHMQSGHKALQEQRFTDAITAFTAALSVKPADDEAAAALHRAQEEKTAYQLSALKEAGTAAMQAENWQRAEQIYTEALTLRSGIAFAESGLKKATVYYGYKQQLDDLIARPHRLSDKAVAKHARSFIATLKLDQKLPAGLSLSTSTLQGLLNAYNKPVAVTVKSDGRSNISLIRGKTYKPFRQKILQLRPGDYTLLARRSGYRDKRINFEVLPNAEEVIVSIGADEKY